MALDAVSVIDRRRLKRRLTAWRIAAVLFALLFLSALVLSGQSGPGTAGLLPHIARVDISGIITDDRKMSELLDKVGKSDQVKAVILDINSPGRHHDRRRGLVRRRTPAGRQEAGGRGRRHARHLRRLYRRARHRPHLRLRQHHHRLGRRDLPMGRRDRAAAHDRRQGRGSEERPVEGSAEPVRARRREGARARRGDGAGIEAAGSSAWSPTVAKSTRAPFLASPTAASTQDVRPSSSSWSTRSATSGQRPAGSTRSVRSPPV